jgi:peptidoglycan/LPS O-acetylase OafA/YrhL
MATGLPFSNAFSDDERGAMFGAIPVKGLLDEQQRKIASTAKAELQPSLDFSRRIPELDGLRGVAIGMVMFVHYVSFAIVARPPALLAYVNIMARPMWSAVDLFFLLSGFLIGGNLLDSRASAKYFSTFYVRRFCRVLPVYFVFIFLVWIAYTVVYSRVGAPLDWVFAGRLPWYSYLSFAQNLWMANRNSSGAIILAITWAFAVEVQFYMVVPALIRFVRRSALPYLFLAGFVIAPLVRLFIVYRFRSNLWATYVLLPCRMDSLSLGVLCAYFLREPDVWNWLMNRRRSVSIVFLMLLAGIPPLNTGGVPVTLLWITIGYGWMSAFYATAMILALTPPRSFLSRALRWRWLTGLGRISYGVYLFHYGVYGLCVWLLTGHGSVLQNWKDFGVILLAVAISITIGKLSWEYFERPIVRWSHTWRYFEPTEKGTTTKSISAARTGSNDASDRLEA